MSLLDSRPYTFDRVVRIILTLVLGALAYFLLSYLKGALIPFAVALLLAYLLDPLVRFYQTRARLKSRALSILAALLTVIGVLTGLVLLIAPSVGRNVQRAGQLISKLASDNNLNEQALEIIPAGLWEEIQTSLLGSDLATILQTDGLSEAATLAIQRILPEIVGVFSGAFNLILGVLGFGVIILYLIFILIDFDAITKGWRTLVPARYLPRVEAMSHDFGEAMSNYFRAQALIATSVGILFAIGFSVISLPLAIVFGLFVGLLNMVPYLQNIAIIPAAFLGLIHALDTGQNFWIVMLMVLGVFAVVQIIQDTILTPRIMGNATGFNPAVIMLSLSVWGQLLGILGLIIALPMTFLILSYYRKFLNASDEANPLTDSPPDPTLAVATSDTSEEEKE